MLRDRWAAGPKIRGDLSNRVWAAAQQAQYPAASGIGYGAKRGIGRVSSDRNHSVTLRVTERLRNVNPPIPRVRFFGDSMRDAMMIRKAHLVLLLAVWGLGHAAAAEDADDYRGGWRTDQGEAHTYEFSIRGDQVRGIYCTYCADATTLAFVDGKLGADGIRFVVTHVNADGSTAYLDQATARFDRGTLIVTGTSGAGSGKFERTLIKDPRGPDPLPII